MGLRALFPECISFVAETRGDPLGAYPTLLVAGSAYNTWLTENVLAPVLKRWSRDLASVGDSAGSVVHDFEWASGRARLAFQDAVSVAATLGDPAVLAVMGVTVNLQRTLGILGAYVLGGTPVPSGRNGRGAFKLSRAWCGLIEYGPSAPYFPFPGAIRPPVHASRLHPQRRDPLHLTNALWCGLADVQRACDDGLVRLRDAIRHDGVITSEDLEHLHAHAVALPHT